MKRTCEKCGTSIITTRADARFCSTRCRVAAHRAAKSDPVPAELRSRDRWVRWRIEVRKGKATKAPRRVSGGYASSTDPTTWADYESARRSREGDGYGFVLGDGIGCIDLDHCLDNGRPTPDAAAFLSRYRGHYIEVSPSGDGLHIWGHAPEGAGTRKTIDGLNVERYSTGRYITVTGNVFQAGALLPL